MSYINKKTRAFRAAGDYELERKRSEGRMKSYPSAIDARAWCDNREDRRQHILELIRRGHGKFIPIEAIIAILLANKDQAIKDLQAEIEVLKRLLQQHGISYEEEITAVLEKKESVKGGSEEQIVEKKESEKSALKEGSEEQMLGKKESEKSARSQEQSLEKKESDKSSLKEGSAGQILEKRESDKSAPKEGSAEQILEKKGSDKSSLKEGSAEQVLEKKESDKSSLKEETVGKKESDKSAPKESSQEQILEKRESDKSAKEGSEEQIQVKVASGEIEYIDVKDVDGESQKEKGDEGSEKEKYDEAEEMIVTAEVVEMEVTYEITPGDTITTTSSPTKYGAGYITTCSDYESIVVDKTSTEKAEEAAEREVSTKELIAEESREAKEEKKLSSKELLLKESKAKSVTGAPQVVDSSYKAQSELALEAIQMLEAIKEIVRNRCSVSSIKNRSNQTVTSLNANQELRCRLDKLKGLPAEVRKFKEQNAEECKKSKADSHELQMCKLERDCLNMRLLDMAQVRKDYDELLRKTHCFDALKAECTRLKNVEAECCQLKVKVKKCEEFEKEVKALMQEIGDCECCMNSQENEIKKLACHIQCLTKEVNRKEDELKTTVMKMRTHIQQTNLQEELELLSCEACCLRNKIEELECEICEKQQVLDQTEQQCKVLQERCRSLMEQLQTEKATNNKLTRELFEKRQALETEKETNSQLTEALRKAIKNDEHLKHMLHQAKMAIKCITRKLEKYDIVGAGRMDKEKENYMKKIKELEEGLAEKSMKVAQLSELEKELNVALEANKALSHALDDLENKSQESVEEFACGAERIRELKEELRHANESLNELRRENEGMKKLIAH